MNSRHYEVDVLLNPGNSQAVAEERREIESHGFELQRKNKFTDRSRAFRYAQAIKKVTGIQVEVYEVCT